MSTAQVSGPVIRGRIGPAGVLIANSSESVWPRWRRYMIAWRAPLPESSASEPSGLKIRRSATNPGVGRAGEQEDPVGADPGMRIADPSGSAPAVSGERELCGLDDQIVVSEGLPLLESHVASGWFASRSSQRGGDVVGRAAGARRRSRRRRACASTSAGAGRSCGSGASSASTSPASSAANPSACLAVPTRRRARPRRASSSAPAATIRVDAGVDPRVEARRRSMTSPISRVGWRQSAVQSSDAAAAVVRAAFISCELQRPNDRGGGQRGRCVRPPTARGAASSGVERVGAARSSSAGPAGADLGRGGGRRREVGQGGAQVEAGAADDDRAAARRRAGRRSRRGRARRNGRRRSGRRAGRRRPAGARGWPARPGSGRRSGSRGRGRPGGRRRRRRPGGRRRRAASAASARATAVLPTAVGPKMAMSRAGMSGVS